MRAALVAGLLLTLSAGCANWSYDRVQLGMLQREAERLLPEGTLWRTELGLAIEQTDWTGRTDALVILLTQDLRVAGKLQTTRTTEGLPGLNRQEHYRLRGLVDPQAWGLTDVGPVDLLRALIDDLASYRGARMPMETHARVAAGIRRLLERWSEADLPPPQYPLLGTALETVPADGLAEVRREPGGAYSFEYLYPPPP